MPEIKIERDLKKTSAIWKRYQVAMFLYFFYRQIAAKIYFVVTISFFIIGLFWAKIFLGFAFTLVVFYFLLALIMMFRSVITHKTLMKYYSNMNTESPFYLFGYDENGIKYDIDSHKMELRWDFFYSAAFTTTEIYLFDKGRIPLEIISRIILNESDFNNIKSLVEKKVKRRIEI